jgi:hypothetical protein
LEKWFFKLEMSQSKLDMPHIKLEMSRSNPPMRRVKLHMPHLNPPMRRIKPDLLWIKHQTPRFNQARGRFKRQNQTLKSKGKNADNASRWRIGRPIRRASLAQGDLKGVRLLCRFAPRNGRMVKILSASASAAVTATGRVNSPLLPTRPHRLAKRRPLCPRQRVN